MNYYHIVHSLEAEDYIRLGDTEAERRDEFRDAVRETMEDFARALNIKTLEWTGGIHRNTEHPHAHVLINKDVIGHFGKAETLNLLPMNMLNRSEENQRGEQVTITGTLSRDLDRAAKSRGRDITAIRLTDVRSGIEYVRPIIDERSQPGDTTAERQIGMEEALVVGKWLVLEAGFAHEEANSRALSTTQSPGNDVIKSRRAEPESAVSAKHLLLTNLRKEVEAMDARSLAANGKRAAAFLTNKQIREMESSRSKTLKFEFKTDPKHLDAPEKAPGRTPAQIEHDRAILADEWRGRARVEELTGRRQSLIASGEYARYAVNDPSRSGREETGENGNGDKRKLSIADITRRAEARAERRVGEEEARAGIVDPHSGRPTRTRLPKDYWEGRRERKEKFAATDLERHRTVIDELKTAGAGSLAKLERGLAKEQRNLTKTEHEATKIRIDYRRRGEELPVPSLGRNDLSKLQERAYSSGDAVRWRELESIREARAAETGRPTRMDREVGRLGEQLYVARAALRVEEDRREQFRHTRHLTPWRITSESGKSDAGSNDKPDTKAVEAHERGVSIGELDRRIEQAHDRSLLFGRRVMHYSPADRAAAAAEKTQLLEQRAKIEVLVAAREAEMDKRLAGAGKLVEELGKAYEREAIEYRSTGTPLPERTHTKEDIIRLATCAENLRDADLRREVFRLDQEREERLPEHARTDQGERLSRIRGHEIASEIYAGEADKRREQTLERLDRVRLSVGGQVVGDGSAGETTPIGVPRTTTLRAEERGTEIARLLRYVIEPAERREMRLAARAATEALAARVVEQAEQAREYLDAVKAEAKILADNLGQNSEKTAPRFSAREEIGVEIYAARQLDPEVRARYEKVLQGEDASAKLASIPEHIIGQVQPEQAQGRDFYEPSGPGNLEVDADQSRATQASLNESGSFSIIKNLITGSLVRGVPSLIKK